MDAKPEDISATQHIELPTLPVETLAFSADPDPYVIAARRDHPWLARFSQGYVVIGYQAACDLLQDDDNLIPECPLL